MRYIATKEHKPIIELCYRDRLPLMSNKPITITESKEKRKEFLFSLKGEQAVLIIEVLRGNKNLIYDIITEEDGSSSIEVYSDS